MNLAQKMRRSVVQARYRARQRALNPVPLKTRGRFPVLTIEQRQSVLARIAKGERRIDVATDFGVSQAYVNTLIRGYEYKRQHPLDVKSECQTL